MRRPDPSLGELRGLADPKHVTPYLTANLTSQMNKTPQVIYQHLTMAENATPSVSLLLDIAKRLPSLLEGFREYVHSRYRKETARHNYNYIRRHGQQALTNPTYISKLTYKQARHLLLGLAALRDYLALMGMREHAEVLDSYLKQLRKLAPKPTKVKLLEYELDKSIIEKALNEVERIVKSGAAYTTKLAALTAFFTGLREPEIVYLLQNYPRLRKILEDGAVIVELGFDRRSKKAWVTIIPNDLAEMIEEVHRHRLSIGMNLVKDARDRHGLHVSIHRKSHAAILGPFMSENEIKLLQGKVGEIMVKHYTKHLRELARRYLEAYKEYIEKLRTEWARAALLSMQVVEQTRRDSPLPSASA
ncbi:hypothetical protein PYJP_04210 [Pyrofollis japonicus]|uniref:integrase n=1 Tax=Pyrofollis japonicus TaxID=3060460 RepID=UPI00295B5066|nr:integrase [Pyrofollis japonicus]BEP17069.1 hypothetical protein PYJP_04210 [Pyrofollis japonicus]